ncbi:DedA family protein [Pseudomonas sp. F1_0610]|uniref:YqaA family protein n=1 Tax=Pseudomonas sp. F1_0610 TaxID=3114284 RepID=UPI0039C09A62
MLPLSALGLLAASGFTSATLLPGSSEVALVVFLQSYEAYAWVAWGVLSVSNTLGSMTSLLIGRIFPPKKPFNPRIQTLIQDYGSLSMLLAWVPVIGDALPVAAGWLRLPFGQCVIYLFIGKSARYLILIGLLQFF